MVADLRGKQWSPTSWPVSFRWRLLAAVIVLAATAVAIIALSRGDDAVAEAPVVIAGERWPAGHPPGNHATVSMPADMAVLFLHPSELADTVAAVDVPEGTLVSAKMLRPYRDRDDTRTTALMRFTVSADLWPDPGPTPGSRAVFSPSPGGCAAALVTLVGIADDGAAARVTVEADPELAAVLSDKQWWIWESPPGSWPHCEREDVR
ncbi:hypothetical protein [Candidatus Poriferisocius sp.]|uniref:hypothetical protein n=1 Tax=Candidatus Poriferisocius sp. TaxID=3101276 RepID=UPI003B026709